MDFVDQMASTPSASALSAVLRFRGNIWTRNPPTKRPVTSVYSLGPAGGVICDSPAERNRSNRASAWEAFLQEGRVVVGRRLTVAIESPQVDNRMMRERNSGEINNLCHPKVSQFPGDAHSAASAVNAPVRQPQRSVASNLQGKDIILQIKHKTYSAHVCKIILIQGVSEFPAGVLKVTITSPCPAGNAGQKPSFVFTGWSTLRNSCLSLSALVSQLMFLKLEVLNRSSSSPDDAPQEDEKNIKNDALQDNDQINGSTDLISTSSASGRRITEDKPD